MPHQTGWLLSGALLIGLLGGALLLPYLTPFIGAVLLAALIDAPVNHLEKIGLPRRWAVLLIIVLLLLFILGTTSLLLVRLLHDLTQLTALLPNVAAQVQESAHGWIRHLLDFTADFPLPLDDAVQGLIQRLTGFLETLLQSSFSTLVVLPNILSDLIVGILATYFMVCDGRALVHHILISLPISWQKRTTHVKKELFAGLVGFVRAELLVMMITCVLTTTVLLLFRVPYAWMLGALAGTLDLLPLVGVGGVFFPLIMGYGYSGKSSLAAGLAAAWGVIVLVRQVCEPALMSTRIGLHPLTSIIVIYIGLRIWGVGGAVLAPLAAIGMKVLWEGALQPFLSGR